MRNLAIIFILATFGINALCSTPVEGEKYSFVSLPEARDLHSQSGTFFIDVNDPEIYDRYHIPGAIHVTSEDLKHFLPKGKQNTIVFYCAERRCYASHAAARQAIKLGYTQVSVMPQGIFGWVQAGLPTEKGRAATVGKPGK